MLLIRSRAEYREYLNRMIELTRGQRATEKRKRELRNIDGIEHGLIMALNGLTEWEIQVPDKKEDDHA